MSGTARFFVHHVPVLGHLRRRTGRARRVGARLAGAVALVLVVLASQAPAATASARSASSGSAPVRPRSAAPSRVVIVSIPRLGWDDVSPRAMPTLAGLADRGALASLSVKTIGRRTTPVEGYASIATGTRATAPEGASASGYAPDERLPPGYEGARRRYASAGASVGPTAADELRRNGFDPRSAAVLLPGIRDVTLFNRGRYWGAETGALGRALHAAGWSTAVIANHDGADRVDRTAALALADPAGRVDLGLVGPALTEHPVGQRPRTSAAAVGRSVAALPTSNKVVAIVEIGDVAWADDAHAGSEERRAAATRTDRVLATVLDRLDLSRDLVIVLSPAAPVAFERPTPFVMAGPGIDAGLAQSATTRRDGYVTLPDIGPTVLGRAGVKPAVSMTGTPITSSLRSSTGSRRVADAREAIAETRFIDRTAGKFIISYPIVFESWSFLLLVWVLFRRARAARLAGLLGPVLVWMGVVISAVPVLAFVLGGFTLRSWHLPIWFTVLWVIAGVVALAALALSARWLVPRSRLANRRPWLAVVVASALTWLVLVADVLTGGRLQFDTPLGNSPTVAGRFSGVGNLAFGLLAASSLLLAWTVATELTRRGRRPVGVGVAAAIFAMTLIVDGAPGLGSDVGGVLVLGPVAAVSCWLLAGRRLSWRAIVVAMLGAAAVVAVFGVIDLARPASERTHLGRLLAGNDHSRDVITRKALAAGGSFLGSVSLAFIPFCVVVLAIVFWMLRRADVLRAFAPGSNSRQLLVTATVLGVAGAALNDSGVMVPAIMAGVLAPAAVALLLAPEPTAKPDWGAELPVSPPVRTGGRRWRR